MNPSTTIGGILISLATVLMVLGLSIFVLDLWEKREDEKEKRNRLYELNFDAL